MKKIVFPIAVIAIIIVASCSKKDNTSHMRANSNTNSTSKIISAKSGFSSLSLMSGDMRRYKKGGKKCIDEKENCHPVDIVITGAQLYSLTDAIGGGGAGVAQLFSDNGAAIGLIPDWNAEWFADVKTAILSGNYTFLQTGESVFLLGREGVVSEGNFDYAVSYDVK